jgi:hypothetical protein
MVLPTMSSKVTTALAANTLLAHWLTHYKLAKSIELELELRMRLALEITAQN